MAFTRFEDMPAEVQAAVLANREDRRRMLDPDAPVSRYLPPADAFAEDRMTGENFSTLLREDPVAASKLPLERLPAHIAQQVAINRKEREDKAKLVEATRPRMPDERSEKFEADYQKHVAKLDADPNAPRVDADVTIEELGRIAQSNVFEAERVRREGRLVVPYEVAEQVRLNRADREGRITS